MTDDPMPWFPCLPTKLLGALSAMKPHVGYTYAIVMLRMYEVGGPCHDSLDAIARRTGYTKRVVSDALTILTAGEEPKLYREDGGWMNRMVRETLDDMAFRREARQASGREGGRQTSKKRQSNQRKGGSNATDSLPLCSTQLQLQIQDSPPYGGERAAAEAVPIAKRDRKKPTTSLPDEFPMTQVDVDYAAAHGFRGQRAQTMFEQFCDYHRSRGNRMADWRAAWRTWVRNEVKFDAKNGPRGGIPARPAGGNVFARMAAQDVAEFMDGENDGFGKATDSDGGNGSTSASGGAAIIELRALPGGSSTRS